MFFHPDHADILVDAQWVSDHLDNPDVRIIDADMTEYAYRFGHIPGAVFWNMGTDLLNADFSLNLETAHMEALLSRSGVSQETTIICCGGLPAAETLLFWLMRVFGHKDVRVLDGSRRKWIAEGRPLETEPPAIIPTHYTAQPPDAKLRAFSTEVQAALSNPSSVLVDVRTPQEFSGEWYYAEPPRGEERAGHIPGAVNIGLEEALNADGTFKSDSEIRELFGSNGITPDKEVITYCTIGARATQTWFVLKHLLGYPRVRNYDGSWGEWSRLP